MNPGLVALLVAALLMASADAEVDTAEILFTGDHSVEDHRGALIVADAAATVEAGAAAPGPIYVIGGELVVAGVIEGDVIQLAGTVRVRTGGVIGGELRHVAGTLRVAEGADVARRTAVVPGADDGSGSVVGPVVAAMVAMALAAAGALVGRRRERAVARVAEAATGHPVVTFTVGLLLTLTFLSVFVFMAFTLVLLPVAILGVVVGAVVLAYGVIAWGYRLGGLLIPVDSAAAATGLGVVMVMALIWAIGSIPAIGDVVVAGVLLIGVGSVVVTYFGVASFRPDPLPGD